VQLVGSEPQFADELASSLEDASSVSWNSNTQRGVYTQVRLHVVNRNTVIDSNTQRGVYTQVLSIAGCIQRY
jgi:hypothetical protein